MVGDCDRAASEPVFRRRLEITVRGLKTEQLDGLQSSNMCVYQSGEYRMDHTIRQWGSAAGECKSLRSTCKCGPGSALEARERGTVWQQRTGRSESTEQSRGARHARPCTSPQLCECLLCQRSRRKASTSVSPPLWRGTLHGSGLRGRSCARANATGGSEAGVGLAPILALCVHRALHNRPFTRKPDN
jgi:hypothetical protein